jgi:hypothetical protein
MQKKKFRTCTPMFSNSEHILIKSKQNSVILVRKRTILTKRPPLVGEASAITSTVIVLM